MKDNNTPQGEKITIEEASNKGILEYRRETATPAQMEEVRKLREQLKATEKLQAAVTRPDGTMMTTEEIIIADAERNLSDAATLTIAAAIADANSALSPDSPLMEVTTEDIVIDTEALAKRLREEMEEIRHTYTSDHLLEDSDLPSISETLDHTKDQTTQTVAEPYQFFDTYHITGKSKDEMDALFKSVMEKVKARIAELTSTELERLKEEAEKEDLEHRADGTELPPALEAIVKEETASAVKGYMLQGQATSLLTKIRQTERNTKINLIDGTATITEGAMAVTLADYSSIKGLDTRTNMLLDALTFVLTQSGARGVEVSMPLDYYMDLRGLKDRKEVRKQVDEDLEILFRASISFREKRRGKDGVNYKDIRVCQDKGIYNGIIQFTFGEKFYNILKKYPLMPIPSQLWRINPKYNPNSYHLLRKLTEHKNMNMGKKNEDIISVKSLLSSCPYLPNHEDVKGSTDRHVKDRIITPFKRDLNVLNPTLTWEYCHQNGTPIEDIKQVEATYKSFSETLIHVFWKDWPDQTPRLERKQALLEAPKEKKKRGRKPKTKHPEADGE